MTVLVFIVLLSLLVVIHELGHFLAARRSGVTVKEFGFGYPPRAWKLFRWRGTLFTLNAVPFGGFVKLEGEEFDGESEHDASPAAFYRQSAWKRLWVIAAGPVANIAFGIVAFSIVFGVFGIPRSLDGRARIEAISPGSPAAEAGLQPGYEVVGFTVAGDFTAAATVPMVVEYVRSHTGQAVVMSVQGPCGGMQCAQQVTELPVTIRTPDMTPAGQGNVGLIFADYYLEKNPWYVQIPQGISYGFQNTVAMSRVIVSALGDLGRQILHGRVPADIAGPVGIVHQASQNHLASQGWGPLLEFAGVLSINLGIMNLLPIPALDGGRIVFVMLEKVLGKHRVQSIEGRVHYAGFVVLLALIILVSIRDIAVVFGR